MSKVLKNTPEAPEMDNMKHVPLTGINKLYELYEDGRIFSRLTGKWIIEQFYCKERNKLGYTLMREDGTYSAYSKECLVRKYILGLPEFDGIKHVPYIHNEDYEVYDNGQIYSKLFYKFLTPHYTKTNWKFVCILDKEGNRKTLYNAKAVWESFNSPLNGNKLDFISGDRKDCSLSNLKLKIKKG